MSGTDNSNREVDANLTEGIVSDRNYVKSNFETGILGWNKFTVSTAGSTPDIRPTGSPTIGTASQITLSANTSNQLDGKASLLMTTASGADALGQGIISDAFIPARADWMKVLSTSFAYEFLTGASNYVLSGVSTNTLEIWIWDQTNSVWIMSGNPFDMNSFAADANSFFQTAASANTYRFAIIFLESFNAVSTVQFDKFKVSRSPSQITNAPIVLAVSGNPTSSITGSASVLILPTVEEQEGINYNTSTGEIIPTAPGFHIFSMSTAINSSGFTDGESLVVGLYQGVALRQTFLIRVVGGQSFCSTSAVSKPIFCNAGDVITWQVNTDGPSPTFYSDATSHSIGMFRIPFSEIAALLGADVVVNASNPTNSVSAGGGTMSGFGTVLEDTAGSFNPSTGIYVVQQPRRFILLASSIISGTYSANSYIQIVGQVDGSNLYGMQNRTGASVTNQGATFIGLTPMLKVGQTIQFNIASDAVGAAYTAGSTFNYISIIALPMTAADLPQSVGFVRVSRSTTQSLNDATYTTAVFDTVEESTMAGYNSSTGIFTVTEPDFYEHYALVSMGGSASGSREMLAGTGQYMDAKPGSGGALMIHGMMRKYYQPGDSISVSIYQSTGSPFLVGGGATTMWMTIKKGG